VFAQNLQSTNIHWQNCTNSAAIKNIIYFIHISLILQNVMPLKPSNVNIACDWLSWWTPLRNSHSTFFDWLKIGLTWLSWMWKRMHNLLSGW